MPAMHPLGELIVSRMRVNGWSTDAVVDRAERAGHTLGRSNLNRIVNAPVVSIKGEVIRALADGIGVSDRLVANAALESMGVTPPVVEVTDALAAVDIDPTLSDANRRQLRLLIEQMRSDSAQGGRRNLRFRPSPGKSAREHRP